MPRFTSSLAITGCALAAALSGQAPSPDPTPPTWANTIAPIVHGRCAPCHRPGEAAPFSLLSYRDVQKRGPMILDVIEDRYMPPWHPAPDGPKMRGERRLTDIEIEQFRQWIDGGMPRGDAGQEPEPPRFPVGWALGEPDLVIEMTEAFPVPAGGRDIYRNFVIPLELEQTRYVTAIEVRPSARSVVHHVLFHLDSSGRARRLDGRDGQPGFRGMGGIDRRETFGGWAVGQTPRHLPDGLAVELPAGSDLVLATHFHPSGKAENEKTRVGLFFADKQPENTYTAFMVPAVYGALWGIDIPAGEAEYHVRDSFTLPTETRVVNAWAHAHMVCKSVFAEAVLPDGSKRLMLHIPQWDFDWQERYSYEQAITLPAGTRIDVDIVYDNSKDNPSNPFSPPRRIRWGRESTDEMGAVLFGAVATDPQDLPKLKRAMRQQLIAAARKRRSSGGRGAGITARLIERVRQLDQNGDGAVVLDEVPRRWHRYFRSLDRDGDGKVLLEELERQQGRRDR